MSTHEGENKEGLDWPTESNIVFLPLEQLELEHRRSLDDQEISPRGHARLANQFRDDYLKLGDSGSLGHALHHYETALDGSDKEPLLQAWIICNRLNIYIHDLAAGRAFLSDLAEELEFARSTLAGASTWRDREFKARTMEWIERTRAEYLDKPAAPETTQKFSIPELRLVGGTAVEVVISPNPAPAPEAA